MMVIVIFPSKNYEIKGKNFIPFQLHCSSVQQGAKALPVVPDPCGEQPLAEQ